MFGSFRNSFCLYNSIAYYFLSNYIYFLFLLVAVAVGIEIRFWIHWYIYSYFLLIFTFSQFLYFKYSVVFQFKYIYIQFLFFIKKTVSFSIFSVQIIYSNKARFRTFQKFTKTILIFSANNNRSKNVLVSLFFSLSVVLWLLIVISNTYFKNQILISIPATATSKTRK